MIKALCPFNTERLFLSTMVGTIAIAFTSTYSAAKVFPLFFAENLCGELVGSGVDPLAVLPGDTRTEFRGVADLSNVFRWSTTAVPCIWAHQRAMFMLLRLS